MAPETLIARQWQRLYNLGKVRAPPLAAATALAFAFLSYQFYGTLDQPRAELYALSALLTILNPPYTWIFMKDVNNKLWAKAEASNASKKVDEAAVAGGQSTKELLDLWAAHNVVRGLLPLAGSIIAYWTTFG